MTSKLTKISYFFVVSILLLTLIRLSLWLIYQDDFSTLNTMEVLQSFWAGLRVDLITIATSCSLFVLLLVLPFKFSDNHRYQKFIGYGWYLILIIILFVLLSDMVYFQFVHRHIGNEITAMSNDTHIVLDMLAEYTWLLMIYVILSLGLFFIFKKIINNQIPQTPHSFAKRSGIMLMVIIGMFLLIRGKVEGKSFSISDAFVVNKSASGNLALNGFFTLYRTITTTQKIYTFYDEDEALDTVKTLLHSDKFAFTDDEFPLSRENISTTKKVSKPNIVIVLLESWSAKYVDSFGNNNFKVTPNFDKLASQGLLFSNFYANGQRSIEGITALFTGLTVLKGMHYLGAGLELSNLSYIANIAKDNGYSSISMQSSDRGSYRVDALSNIAGFEHYYGAEDMPLIGDENKSVKPKFGTWDGNMYQLLSQKLSIQKEPFLSFCFTATTHSPFISPGKKWEPYPHNNTNLYGFLNTLSYADNKLGEFMQRSQKEPWFDNTIFIFMADHTIGFGDDSKLFKDTDVKVANRPLEGMRIPLLIYAPKFFKHQVIETIGSQADIIPTLMDILDWKGSFSTLSHSLFSPQDEQFVLFPA